MFSFCWTLPRILALIPAYRHWLHWSFLLFELSLSWTFFSNLASSQISWAREFNSNVINFPKVVHCIDRMELRNLALKPLRKTKTILKHFSIFSFSIQLQWKQNKTNNQKQLDNLKIYIYCASLSQKNKKEGYLRHNDNTEIQPVPWISKEGEFCHAKSSRQYFYQWLKSVNASESVPGE